MIPERYVRFLVFAHMKSILVQLVTLYIRRLMKDMIMMRYKDGKTHAEIGELLGVSEEQVYHTCACFFRRARHPQYARALRKYNVRAPFEEN